jgi:signal transduction histidine kinase
MLIIVSLTTLGLYLAQQSVTRDAQRDLNQDFRAKVSALEDVQNLRHAALLERCRLLVEKSRLHAALEDNALDLLYPTAADELRELMQGEEAGSDQSARVLRARFYRFLNRNGSVIPAPDPTTCGNVPDNAESRLTLPAVPVEPQTGYLRQTTGVRIDRLDEVMAMPIFSTETGDVIAALAVGFKPLEGIPGRPNLNMRSGIWVDGGFYLPALPQSAASAVASAVFSAVAGGHQTEGSFETTVDDTPHLLFYKKLNPDSVFHPAYEIYLYPLSGYQARQRRLVWQIGVAGAVLLTAGLVASHLIAARLSAPVEKLALDSEHDRAERQRAQAALETTSEELERTARYSADASHELKSPVTLLRAGLEALLAREDLAPEIYNELSALIHQTYRLTGVIDDLLLLARMDAGQLQIQASAVNLSQLIEEWLDDVSAMQDSAQPTIDKQVPNDLYVAGERRYTSLVVHNLLENARKYNRPAGTIRIKGKAENKMVRLTVANTGTGIPLNEQATIFHRFHRGPARDEVPGHGLGLNLARELARLHGGELLLVQSRDDWTEFEVSFRAASPKSEARNPVKM